MFYGRGVVVSFLRSMNSWLYFCRQGERITRGLVPRGVAPSPRVVSPNYTYSRVQCEMCKGVGHISRSISVTTLFSVRYKTIYTSCVLCKGLGFVLVKFKKVRNT